MGRKLKIQVPRPWIAYPGSTIQQNFGETQEKGFLCWDVKGRSDFDVRFHPIPNPCPFITIEWKGTVKQTLKAAKGHVTKGSRIRIRSEETIVQSEIRQLYSELRVLYDPVEIVLKIDGSRTPGSATPDDITTVTDDLRNADTLVNLMKEFLKASELSASDWDAIRAHVDRYIRSLMIGTDTVGRHTKWSIKRLEFENTFAFGRKNVIDFEKLQGVVGVFAPNARGKSSIIGTLMYALFNATDRGPIKNLHIINTRKGECAARVVLNVNGSNDYKIERKTVKKEPKKGLIHGVTSLEFHRIDASGNPIEDATGEVRTDTEREIRKLIGTADDFLLTSLASQGDINRFINEGATQRKMILARMLDLDVLEQMSAQAKEESNGIKAQLKSAPDRDWDTLIDELRSTLADSAGNFDGMNDEIMLLRAQLSEAQVRQARLDRPDTITQADIDDHEETVTALKAKIASLEVKLQEATELQAGVSSKIESIVKFKENFPIEALRGQKEAQDSLTAVLVGMQHSLQVEQRTLTQQEKSAEKLSEVPCGDSFPTCKFIKDSHIDRQKIDTQRLRVEELTAQVVSTRTSLEKAKQADIDAKIAKYQEFLKRESEFRVQLVKAEASIAGHEKDIEHSHHRLKETISRLDDLRARVIDGDVTNELNQAKRDVKMLNGRLNSCDSQRLSLVESIAKLKSQVERAEEEREKYSDLRNKWRLYEHMMSALSKRGIPSQIIHRLLPRINVEISKILQGVVDFTVTLELDIESNSMDIYIDYGDSRRIIELASGMEKMIASLAIRVALINVSSLPKTDMFIIDEGFGTLDESNIAACGRLLESLKQWFRIIIVISHVDGIKDAADCIIELTKYGKDSHVDCT